MKRYQFEIKMDIEEHVPIVIQASGRDLKALLENAEYSVDCPDPKQYFPIGDLTERCYERVVQKIAERITAEEDAELQARLRRRE